MIYTVTFNPALDYVMRANAFSIGKTNRSEGESIYFGGKGINVSCVLGELGEATTALGFVAGFTGEALEKGLTEMGIKTDFVHLAEGMTRINIKIKGAEETELNAKGPSISADELDMMMEKLEKIQDGDTLVLAGSVPGSLPSDIYERILERLSGKKIRTVVDAEKELLTRVLKYRPFLIKPNIHELSAIVGKELTSDAETEAAARELQSKGAVNVLVSLGGDGALLVDENGEVHRIGVAKITAVNTVGAGDSMVAGFLAGANKGYGYALRLGTASGGATAASSGLATKEKIFELLGTL